MTDCQCGKIGRFLKSFGGLFLEKVPKIDDYFLGSSEKHNSSVKTTVSPFWTTFGKTWATFISTSGPTAADRFDACKCLMRPM